MDLKVWAEIMEILETEYKKSSNLAEYSDKDAALLSQAYFAVRNLVNLDKFGLSD